MTEVNVKLSNDAFERRVSSKNRQKPKTYENNAKFLSFVRNLK